MVAGWASSTNRKISVEQPHGFERRAVRIKQTWVMSDNRRHWHRMRQGSEIR